MIRTFVAIALDEPIQAALARTVERFKRVPAKVTWVPAANIHITVQFLGDVEDGRIAQIGGALDEAVGGLDPFVVAFAGLGCFGKPARPSVIWAGVKENAPVLSQVHGRIQTRMEGLGFPPEKRRFSPHSTLGRVRGSKAVGELLEAIERNADAEFGSMTVHEVRLMRSTLTPHGAEHTVMSTHPLGGGAG